MRWAGMVRNVMLGREGLSRDVLLDVVRTAGGMTARSYLTTGNVTFSAARGDLDGVVEGIESAIEQVLGRREMVAVRSLPWLRALVAADRFAGFPDEEWATEVAFLRHDAPGLKRSRIGDPRRTVLVEVRSREVLAARPLTGAARPHVSRLLEQAVHRPVTARGWSTLQRVAASHPAGPWTGTRAG
jgi:uncharacterized protein (DUF1697 family)